MTSCEDIASLATAVARHVVPARGCSFEDALAI